MKKYILEQNLWYKQFRTYPLVPPQTIGHIANSFLLMAGGRKEQMVKFFASKQFEIALPTKHCLVH